MAEPAIRLAGMATASIVMRNIKKALRLLTDDLIYYCQYYHCNEEFFRKIYRMVLRDANMTLSKREFERFLERLDGALLDRELSKGLGDPFIRIAREVKQEFMEIPVVTAEDIRKRYEEELKK